MSDPILYSQLEPNETLVDSDIMPMEQPASGGLRRQKGAFLSALKTFFQKDIKDGTEQLNPRSFTSGRFDSQELVSGTLSVSGWYTIAEADTLGNIAMGARFDIVFLFQELSFEVSVYNGTHTKTHENTYMKIKKQGNFVERILGVRLVKSDSVIDAGFKIQVNLNVSTPEGILSQITNNLARGVSLGFTLVTPYLDNTPTLPDGVTVGTFLEAGEELSLDNAGSAFNFIYPFGVTRISDDAVNVTVEWPEISKQGTGLTITLPTTSFDMVAYDGTLYTVTGAHTISNFGIRGKIVSFRINEVGAFTGTSTFQPLHWFSRGSGSKLTIT